MNANPPPGQKRCTAAIKLRDHSGAQCMRRAVEAGLCRQHIKAFKCCGGNDATPTEHTQDCPAMWEGAPTQTETPAAESTDALEP